MSSIEFKKIRVNERIRAREVLLIDEEGNKLGEMPVEKAQETAREKDLDLVEIAPDSKPPVCKIMDFGKYKYQMTKRAHDAKKHQKVIQVKEVTFRPKIDEHDYAFKKNHTVRFLQQGNKVKAVIIFRGREIIYTNKGKEILERLLKDIDDLGFAEYNPKVEGHRMTMIISPKKEK